MDLDLEQIMNSSKNCKDLDLTRNWRINQDWRWRQQQQQPQQQQQQQKVKHSETEVETALELAFDEGRPELLLPWRKCRYGSQDLPGHGPWIDNVRNFWRPKITSRRGCGLPWQRRQTKKPQIQQRRDRSLVSTCILRDQDLLWSRAVESDARKRYGRSGAGWWAAATGRRAGWVGVLCAVQ